MQAGLSPEQKLAAIQAAQQQGSSSAASVRGNGVIMVSQRGAYLCAAASDTSHSRQPLQCTTLSNRLPARSQRRQPNLDAAGQ